MAITKEMMHVNCYICCQCTLSTNKDILLINLKIVENGTGGKAEHHYILRS